MKRISKKLFVTTVVLAMGYSAPIVFSRCGITADVTLSFMALLTGIGVAYGVVQGKIDAALAGKNETPK